MESLLDQLRIIGYVVFAMFLGGIIGWDREQAGKAAGLRTQMLVAGASTLFVFLGHFLTREFGMDFGEDHVISDPTRIIQAIVLGIGFLGSGTIAYSKKEEIVGLTTAATLLFSAAVGICVGVSQFVLASGLTLCVVAALKIFRHFEEKVIHKTNH